MGKNHFSCQLPGDCAFFFLFCLQNEMVKQLSNAFRDSISLWFSSVQRNRRLARKKGANHICVSLLSINLLMFDRAQRTAKHTVFVCKGKRHSQGRSYIAAKVDAKRDLYFRSANGVSVTATEAVAAALSSSSSSSMTERPLFYFSLSIIISFFNG